MSGTVRLPTGDIVPVPAGPGAVTTGIAGTNPDVTVSATGGGGAGGGVSSVNGATGGPTGAVILTAADVGADRSGLAIAVAVALG